MTAKYMAYSFPGMHFETVDKDADVKQNASKLSNLAKRGELRSVEELLDQGIKPTAEALYLAANDGHSDVVQILADVVDDIDAAVGFCGNALCAAAARSSSHDCLKVLLEKGADVNWPGGHYGCALQTATANYRLDNVILLLKYGADVNAQCGHYGNVMTAAARHSTHFTEMSRLFLEHGADINAQGPGVYGNALQTAVWLKRTEAVQFLLHNGASPIIQGRFGSAIDIAQRNAFRYTYNEKAGERVKWLLNDEDTNELTAAD
jgi:ankyrin repeat protein